MNIFSDIKACIRRRYEQTSILDTLEYIRLVLVATRTS